MPAGQPRCRRCPTAPTPSAISDSVVDKVAEMLAEEGDPSLQLRIFVTGGGCSGFQYGFAFDDEVKEDDVRVARVPSPWWSTR
jgi:iron-sulfur cluster insertion protein